MTRIGTRADLDAAPRDQFGKLALHEADLRGADLSGATITGADLNKAVLTDTDLTNVHGRPLHPLR